MQIEIKTPHFKLPTALVLKRIMSQYERYKGFPLTITRSDMKRAEQGGFVGKTYDFVIAHRGRAYLALCKALGQPNDPETFSEVDNAVFLNKWLAEPYAKTGNIASGTPREFPGITAVCERFWDLVNRPHIPNTSALPVLWEFVYTYCRLVYGEVVTPDRLVLALKAKGWGIEKPNQVMRHVGYVMKPR